MENARLQSLRDSGWGYVASRSLGSRYLRGIMGVVCLFHSCSVVRTVDTISSMRESLNTGGARARRGCGDAGTNQKRKKMSVRSAVMFSPLNRRGSQTAPSSGGNSVEVTLSSGNNSFLPPGLTDGEYKASQIQRTPGQQLGSGDYIISGNWQSVCRVIQKQRCPSPLNTKFIC